MQVRALRDGYVAAITAAANSRMPGIPERKHTPSLKMRAILVSAHSVNELEALRDRTCACYSTPTSGCLPAFLSDVLKRYCGAAHFPRPFRACIQERTD